MIIPMERRQILSGLICFWAAPAFVLSSSSNSYSADNAFSTLNKYLSLIPAAFEEAYKLGVRFRDGQRRKSLESLIVSLEKLEATKRAFIRTIDHRNDNEIQPQLELMSVYLRDTVSELESLDRNVGASSDFNRSAQEIMSIKRFYVEKFQEEAITKEEFVKNIKMEADRIREILPEMKKYLTK